MTDAQGPPPTLIGNKTVKALIALDTGGMVRCDVIEFENKKWLVPSWQYNKAKGLRRPMRVILLDIIPHQPSPLPEVAWVLNHPLPKALLDGQLAPGEAIGFVVYDEPNVVQADPDKMN
jgi:hypothetical protein